MRELTYSELDRLQARALETDESLQMDQDTFSGMYERTARPLWVFLWRRTGDAQLADDLLQETYYRFLKMPNVFESEAHRKNYLYRIATNLAHDMHRAHVPQTSIPDEREPGHPASGACDIEQSERRADLNRAMAQLKPRQRDALWLAYAEGASHQEIAMALGLKASSVKLLLFRARRKLAILLGGERTMS
jgi:RNA polymerase sigma-70 factor (ECF subfamily)